MIDVVYVMDEDVRDGSRVRRVEDRPAVAEEDLPPPALMLLVGPSGVRRCGACGGTGVAEGGPCAGCEGAGFSLPVAAVREALIAHAAREAGALDRTVDIRAYGRWYVGTLVKLSNKGARIRIRTASGKEKDLRVYPGRNAVRLREPWRSEAARRWTGYPDFDALVRSDWEVDRRIKSLRGDDFELVALMVTLREARGLIRGPQVRDVPRPPSWMRKPDEVMDDE